MLKPKIENAYCVTGPINRGTTSTSVFEEMEEGCLFISFAEILPLIFPERGKELAIMISRARFREEMFDS